MKTRNMLAAAIIAATTAGCGSVGDNEMAGGILGGVAGAVVGNQFGSGSGRTAMTALGAVIGSMAGSGIGRNLDAQSRNQADRAAVAALERGTVDEPITWENLDNKAGPARGSTVVTRAGTRNGYPCREFRSTISVGGRDEQGYGTACLDASGDWKITSSG